jgi:hypothetical protein
MNRKSLTCVFFLFFISIRCPFAQQFQLSDKAKNKIEQNIVNSTTWQRLQELKMLQTNFGYSLGNNSPYVKQINDIYEQYSYT